MGVRKILLFSTGLDSFVLKHLLGFSNEECLFVNMGTKENLVEEERINRFFPEVIRSECNINEYELKNKIIPYRNNFLALIAAQYGNNIYFAFTAGDTTKDKDYVFKSQMEGILNYFSLDRNKVKFPGPYYIHMPVKHLTKVQIVARYLHEGYSRMDLISKSISCYAGGTLSCGICRSCLRKYVALILNGINGDFELHPSKKLMEEFLQESIEKNRGYEIDDIKQCINGMHS